MTKSIKLHLKYCKVPMFEIINLTRAGLGIYIVQAARTWAYNSSMEIPQPGPTWPLNIHNLN